MDSLPTEMMLDIASYLPPETQAALALSNRKALQKLGSASLNLSGQSKHRQLLLLAKDGLYPDDIPCPFCLRFHSSHDISNPWGNQYPKERRLTGPRDCQGYFEGVMMSSIGPAPGMSALATKEATSSFLGPHVHFNTVAALMRSHRLGLTNEMSSTRETTLAGISKICRYEDFRIVNGHLLLKTEMLLLLPRSTKHLLKDVKNAVARMDRDSWTSHTCGHSMWKDVYNEVLGPVNLSRARSKFAKQQKYLWTHKKSCSGCRLSAKLPDSFGLTTSMKSCGGRHNTSRR